MSNDTRFVIVGKLTANTAFLIAILVGIAALITAQLNDVIELEGRTEDVRVPQLQRIAAVELNVTRASRYLRHAILEQMSTASAEKGHGVSQVGQSITHIGQATQQNAALVEGCAAAAANLDRQAQKLVESVATFKSKKSEGYAASPLQPTASSKPFKQQRKLHLKLATA